MQVFLHPYISCNPRAATLTSSKMESSSHGTLNFKEKVYLRHATLYCRRAQKNMTKSVIDDAIIEANNGDSSAATTAKYLSAKNITKNVYRREGRPYFFVPNAFGTKFIQQVVQGSALCALVGYIEEVEKNSEEMNMSTTLQGSDNPLYFLDMEHNAVANGCNLLGNKFLEFEATESVCDIFRSLVSSSKIPTLVSHITYEVGKICGLVNHQDVDSTFFSAIIILKDTPNGRLHISGVDFLKNLKLVTLSSSTREFFITLRLLHVKKSVR